MNSAKQTTQGSLKISANAVLKIAETAAAEVKGAALSNTGRLASPKGLLPFSEMFASPVKVKFSADAIVIDVAVMVLPGYKAHLVAEEIQSGVKSAVQSMTGVAVSKVNVKIAGILPEKTE